MEDYIKLSSLVEGLQDIQTLFLTVCYMLYIAAIVDCTHV